MPTLTSAQIIYWSGADGLTAESESFKALRTVAKQLKGKMVFVTSNTDGDSHEPITNYFGLKGETGPVVSNRAWSGWARPSNA